VHLSPSFAEEHGGLNERDADALLIQHAVHASFLADGSRGNALRLQLFESWRKVPLLYKRNMTS